MASPTGSTEAGGFPLAYDLPLLGSVDMNDPSNLSLFSRLLLFRKELSEEDILWHNVESSQQRILQSLAHHLGLEYEFSLATGIARISRPTPPELMIFSTAGDFDFMDLDQIDDNNGLSETIPRMTDDANAICTPIEMSISTSQPDTSSGLSSRSPPPGQSTNDEDYSAWIDWDLAISGTYQDQDWLRSLLDGRSMFQLSQNPPLSILSLPDQEQSQDTLHGPSRIGRHGSCQAGSVSVPSHDPIPSECRIFGSSICPDGPGTNYGLNPGFSTSVGASESHALPTILSLEIDRTKPDSCVICQRYSTQVEDLKLHQRSHRKDRPVQCPQCRRSFAHSDFLPRHQPHVHTLATPSSNTRDIMSNTNYSSVGQPDLNMESERDICNPFHNPTSTAHSEFPSDSPHPEIAYSTSSLYHPIQSNPVTPSNQNWDETFEWANPSNPSPSYFDPPSFTPRQASSKPVSVNSIQSDRGRSGLNMFSSRKSIGSGTSSEYQEIIFDSNSVHSGSRTSASSGRRGPLGGFARKAMNAVKSVGACWRCKYLRKSCDPQSPCDLCPEKNGNSNWEAVGCKRGPIKSRMVPIALCPINDLFRYRTISPTGETTSLRLYAQICWRKAIERREKELVCMGISITDYDAEDITLPPDWKVLAIIDCFPDSRYSSLSANLPIPLVPLNECLLGIVWEFLDRPSNCTILNADGTLQSFMPLLRSAVLYQAKIETDRLIAQSLICLRSCLEAMRVKAAGFLKEPAHGFCSPSSCKIECISNLDMHLSLYLDELSRVFFKKENMRNKKPWWLSIFYSFCIQSTVRKALIVLENDAVISNTDGGSLVRKQYLHLPVRLFIASSGPYDPLIKCASSSHSSADRDGPSALDCEVACIAVNQAEWNLRGIRCSGDYLKELFEDAGDTLP